MVGSLGRGGGRRKVPAMRTLFWILSSWTKSSINSSQARFREHLSNETTGKRATPQEFYTNRQVSPTNLPTIYPHASQLAPAKTHPSAPTPPVPLQVPTSNVHHSKHLSLFHIFTPNLLHITSSHIHTPHRFSSVGTHLSTPPPSTSHTTSPPPPPTPPPAASPPLPTPS